MTRIVINYPSCHYLPATQSPILKLTLCNHDHHHYHISPYITGFNTENYYCLEGFMEKLIKFMQFST